MPLQLRVFVSHSHQDDAFCRQLVSALRDAGADVWYDEHNMGSGQLRRVIEQELKTRPVFVLILSAAALGSQWVEDEADWAYDLYFRDRTRTILPVLATSVSEDSIWLFMRGFKRIEDLGVRPYPPAEAVQRTLQALGLNDGENIASAQETAQELSLEAEQLNFQGRGAEALPLLERAAQLDPGSFDAWDQLSITFLWLDRFKEALQAADRALAIDSTRSETWDSKAHSLNALGRYREAIQIADQALAIAPARSGASVYCWVPKVHALTKLGRCQEAVQGADQALAIGTNVFLWGLKARALNQMGHYQAALAAAENGLHIRKADGICWEGKATALRGLHRIKEAEIAEAYAESLYKRHWLR